VSGYGETIKKLDIPENVLMLVAQRDGKFDVLRFVALPDQDITYDMFNELLLKHVEEVLNQYKNAENSR
jgi:hypothetical protein